MPKPNIRGAIITSTKPHKSFSKRVIESGLWVFSLKALQHIFNFARLIILARILSPNDFGLIGIALLTLATLETFSYTGFQAALIQKKDDIKQYLDSVWTFLIVRGIALFIIVYLIAPHIAIFFETSEARLIIRIVGLSFLIGGFTNIGVVFFQKKLEFNKEFKYQLAATITDFIVSVVTVLILRNVWALVLGLLAGKTVRCVTSYLFHPYRPHLHFSLRKVQELFDFGKWIFVSSILVFLITQGDDAFVGKVLGTTALGFYQLAYKISNIPATEISHVIARVTFPAYSIIRDNILNLRESYLRTLQVTVFLSLPVTGLTFVLAPDFTKVFLGEKWMPMVPTMQMLTLFGMLRAIGATTGAVFMAVGKPEARTRIQFGQLVLLTLIIYPLSMRWGILGTSMAVTAYALIFNTVAVHKVFKIIESNSKGMVKLFMIPLIGTSLAILSVFGVKVSLFASISLASFLALITVGMIVYILAIHFFYIIFDYEDDYIVHKQIIMMLGLKNK